SETKDIGARMTKGGADEKFVQELTTRLLKKMIDNDIQSIDDLLFLTTYDKYNTKVRKSQLVDHPVKVFESETERLFNIFNFHRAEIEKWFKTKPYYEQVLLDRIDKESNYLRDLIGGTTDKRVSKALNDFEEFLKSMGPVYKEIVPAMVGRLADEKSLSSAYYLHGKEPNLVPLKNLYDPRGMISIIQGELASDSLLKSSHHYLPINKKIKKISDVDAHEVVYLGSDIKADPDGVLTHEVMYFGGYNNGKKVTYTINKHDLEDLARANGIEIDPDLLVPGKDKLVIYGVLEQESFIKKVQKLGKLDEWERLQNDLTELHVQRKNIYNSIQDFEKRLKLQAAHEEMIAAAKKAEGFNKQIARAKAKGESRDVINDLIAERAKAYNEADAARGIYYDLLRQVDYELAQKLDEAVKAKKAFVEQINKEYKPLSLVEVASEENKAKIVIYDSKELREVEGGYIAPTSDKAMTFKIKAKPRKPEDHLRLLNLRGDYGGHNVKYYDTRGDWIYQMEKAIKDMPKDSLRILYGEQKKYIEELERIEGKIDIPDVEEKVKKLKAKIARINESIEHIKAESFDVLSTPIYMPQLLSKKMQPKLYKGYSAIVRSLRRAQGNIRKFEEWISGLEGKIPVYMQEKAEGLISKLKTNLKKKILEYHDILPENAKDIDSYVKIYKDELAKIKKEIMDYRKDLANETKASPEILQKIAKEEMREKAEALADDTLENAQTLLLHQDYEYKIESRKLKKALADIEIKGKREGKTAEEIEQMKDFYMKAVLRERLFNVPKKTYIAKSTVAMAEELLKSYDMAYMLHGNPEQKLKELLAMGVVGDLPASLPNSPKKDLVRKLAFILELHNGKLRRREGLFGIKYEEMEKYQPMIYNPKLLKRMRQEYGHSFDPLPAINDKLKSAKHRRVDLRNLSLGEINEILKKDPEIKKFLNPGEDAVIVNPVTASLLRG
ncbi:MAG: hypothetical protein D6710_04900, partial [Nitrospirae bacterium]